MRYSFLCLLLASACAAVPECGDPYQTGLNHGVLNAYEADRLASRCSGFNAARYQEGFAEGFSRRGRVYSL